MARIATDIVEVRTKVGEIIVEHERLRFAPIDLQEFLSFVERDLGLGGFQFKPRIPSPTIGAVEAAAGRMSIGECPFDATSLAVSLAARRPMAAWWLEMQAVAGWLRLASAWQCNKRRTACPAAPPPP